MNDQGKTEKEWLSTSEALEYIKEQSYSSTLHRVGLRSIGLTHNFLRKKEDGFYLEFSRKGIDEYFLKIDDGLMTIHETAIKYKISADWVYKLIKKYDIKYTRYRSVKYISQEEFEKKYKEHLNGKNKK